MSRASVAWTTLRREEGFTWKLKSLVTNWKLQVNSWFWSVSGFINVWYTLWVCVPWSDLWALKLLMDNFLPWVGGFHATWLLIKKLYEVVFIKMSRKKEICSNSFKNLEILGRKSLYCQFSLSKTAQQDELLFRKLPIIFRAWKIHWTFISWGAVSCISEYLINRGNWDSIPNITPSEF